MQPHHREQFDALWAFTATKYPSYAPTEGTVDAYWEDLKHLPWEAVRHALQTATDWSDTFFPGSGQLKIVAFPIVRKLSRQKAQLELERMLPEKCDNALQDFFSKCDDILAKNLGEKVDDTNEWILEGLLIALGRVYKVSREEMKGFRAEDGSRRISLLPAPLAIWRDRGADPTTVVDGLRKIPSIFAKYPTPKMMEDVIRGFPTHGYPDEWLNETEAEKEAKEAAAQ